MKRIIFCLFVLNGWIPLTAAQPKTPVTVPQAAPAKQVASVQPPTSAKTPAQKPTATSGSEGTSSPAKETAQTPATAAPVQESTTPAPVSEPAANATAEQAAFEAIFVAPATGNSANTSSAQTGSVVKEAEEVLSPSAPR